MSIKKIKYEDVLTRRQDGRWQKVALGKCLIDKDPERLMKRVEDVLNPPSPEAPLFSDAADAWLEAHSFEGISYKTIQGYSAPLKRLKAVFGQKPLTDISPAEIKAFINGLAKKGYKRTTVQRPLDVMRMIFDYSITTPGSCVTTNPCTSVGLPSGLKQERRDLAASEDIDKVRAGVHLPFGLFAYLLLYTGFRKGEALALTRQDFDLKAGTISVSKSVSWQTNKPVIKQPKTAAGIRTVVLLDPLRAELPKKWRGYLFSGDGGKTPLSSIEFRHRWEAYCRAAGLADSTVVERKVVCKNGLKHQDGKEIVKTYRRTVWHYNFVPHQLRHEFATMCFDAEIPAIDAQEMLGHAKVETTEAIYTHIRESRRIKSGQKLNDYVKIVSGNQQ